MYTKAKPPLPDPVYNMLRINLKLTVFNRTKFTKKISLSF